MGAPAKSIVFSLLILFMLAVTLSGCYETVNQAQKRQELEKRVKQLELEQDRQRP